VKKSICLLLISFSSINLFQANIFAREAIRSFTIAGKGKPNSTMKSFAWFKADPKPHLFCADWAPPGLYGLGGWHGKQKKMEQVTPIDKDGNFSIVVKLSVDNPGLCKWNLELAGLHLEGVFINFEVDNPNLPDISKLGPIECQQKETSNSVGIGNFCKSGSYNELKFSVNNNLAKINDFSVTHLPRHKNSIEGVPLRTLTTANGSTIEIFPNLNGELGANSPVVISGTYDPRGLTPGRYDMDFHEINHSQSERRYLKKLISKTKNRWNYLAIEYDIPPLEAEHIYAKRICDFIEKPDFKNIIHIVDQSNNFADYFGYCF